MTGRGHHPSKRAEFIIGRPLRPDPWARTSEWRRHILVPLFAALLAPLVFFLVRGDGDCIDTGEPAVEIDVGAASRTEREECRGNRLAADGTRLLGNGVGHEENMEAQALCANMRPSS